MNRAVVLMLVAITVEGVAAAFDVEATAEARHRLAADKPFVGVCPRVLPPEGTLTVLREYPDTVVWRITLGALQGVVNRSRPRLWLGVTKPLRWFQAHCDTCVVDIVSDRNEVLDRFRDDVKGLAVWDPALDATCSIAMTLAGLEDLLPVTAEQAQELQARYDWPIRHDFTGRWTDRVTAYTWALEELRPRCNDWALYHQNSGYDPAQVSDQAMGCDYAVQHRMFCWHLARNPVEGEMELTERILTSVAFHAMVFGDSHMCETYAEPLFVTLCSKYGCLHSHSGAGNLSVLCSLDLPDSLFRQAHPPAPPLESDRIYISFMISEEDNLGHLLGWADPLRPSFWTDDPYRIWWSDPERGRVPIGWAFGPLGRELAPTTIAHYYAGATENDCFMAGLGGICLGEPSHYGEAYPERQQRLLGDYIRLTAEYMKRQDMTVLNIPGDVATLKRFCEESPGLEGIFVGYGPKKGFDYDRSHRLSAGVPVFYDLIESTVGTGRGLPVPQQNRRKARQLLEKLQAVEVTERPGFLYVWTIGWDWGPTTLGMVVAELGPEYVVVRPDHLCALYAQWRENRDRQAAEIRYEPQDPGWAVDAPRLPVQAHCASGFPEAALAEMPLDGWPRFAEAAGADRLRIVACTPDGAAGTEVPWQLVTDGPARRLVWPVPAQEATRASFCVYLAEPVTPVPGLRREQTGPEEAVLDTGRLRLRLALGGEDGPAPVLEIAPADGDWLGLGRGVGYSARKRELSGFECRERVGRLLAEYEYRYQFGPYGTRVVKLTTAAGLPYAVIEETTDRMDLPSWSFDFAPNLQPDRLTTSGGAQSLGFDSPTSRGSLPDYAWALLSEGNDGPAAGLIALDEDQWTAAGAVFWTLPGPSAYCEFYGDKPGTRKLALVALPELDRERVRRLWRQLNTPVQVLTGTLETP